MTPLDGLLTLFLSHGVAVDHLADLEALILLRSAPAMKTWLLTPMPAAEDRRWRINLNHFKQAAAEVVAARQKAIHTLLTGICAGDASAARLLEQELIQRFRLN